MSSEKYCKWWENQGPRAQEQYATLAFMNTFVVICIVLLWV
jgi:hypothetical protein